MPKNEPTPQELNNADWDAVLNDGNGKYEDPAKQLGLTDEVMSRDLAPSENVVANPAEQARQAKAQERKLLEYVANLRQIFPADQKRQGSKTTLVFTLATPMPAGHRQILADRLFQTIQEYAHVLAQEIEEAKGQEDETMD